MLTTPWQRAILSALGEDGIAGTIATPADQAYVVYLAIPFDCVITGIDLVTTAGDCDVAIDIAGTPVAGLTAINATNVKTRTDATAGSATRQAQAGDTLTLTVSNNNAAADLSYVLYLVR